MADDSIGGFKLEIGGDIRGLQKAVAEGKVSVDQLGKFLEQRLDKSTTSAERSVNRLVKELTGVRPTTQLNQLAVALEKIGGTSKLTEIQVGNLQRKIEGLRSAGGTVPASLQGLAKSLEGIGAAGDKLKGAGLQSIEGLSSKLGPLGSAMSAIGPAGLAAAAGIGAFVVAGKGLGDLIGEAANWADKITDTATALGTTTTGVQKLEHAAAVAQVPLETVTSSILKMQRVMESSPEKFERLGLSMEKLKALAPEEQFRLVAERLDLVRDSGQRNALAMELLGKSWADLAPLVRGGLAAMDEAKTMSEEQVAELDNLKRELSILGKEWDRFWITVGGGLAGGSRAGDVIRTIADAVRGLGNIVDSLPMDKLMLLARISLGISTGGLSEIGRAAFNAVAESGAESRAQQGHLSHTQFAEAMTRRRDQLRDARENQAQVNANIAAEAAAEAADKKRRAAEQAAAREQAESEKRLKALVAAAQARTAPNPFVWEDLNWNGLPGLMTEGPTTLQTNRHAGSMLQFASGDFGREIPNALEEIDARVKLNFGSMQDWAAATQSVVAAFDMLGITAEDSLGRTLTGLANTLTATGQLAASVASGNVAGMVQGGTQMLGAYAQSFRGQSAGNRFTSALSTGAGLLPAGISALFGSKGPQAGKGADVGIESVNTLIDQLNSGSMAAEDMAEAFDQAFGELQGGLIDKTTGLLTENARALIDNARSAGIASEAIKGLMLSQAQALGGNLAGGVAGIKSTREKTGQGLASQSAASGIGAAISADFSSLVEGGMSTREALEALAPAISTFREELSAAGFEGGAAFDDLAARLNVFQGEVTGPLVDGITSFTGALANMSNLGILTEQTFGGITAQIGANIEALAREGVEGPAAIAALQPQLQTIWELQQKHGFAVDESTQNLIDMAVQGGQVGEEFRSAQDRMADAAERTADAVEALARALVGVGKAVDAIPSSKTISIQYQTSGEGAPPTEEPEEFATGSGGIRNFGRGTPAILHGEEGVFTRTQLNDLLGGAFARGATSMPSTFGGADLSELVAEQRATRRMLQDMMSRIPGWMRDAQAVAPERR